MKHNLITRYFDAATGDSGGVAPYQPTLADLSNPDYVPPDGSKQASLDEATRVAEESRVAAEQTAATAYEALVAEAKNDDGTLKSGYVEANGKITKDATHQAAAGGTDDDDTPEKFFEDVNKLHGVDFKVEYPEGLDPYSPAGVHHRDKSMMEIGIQDFENHLKKADPRGYAYMLHRQAGGDDDTFFTNKTFSLPEYDTLKDNIDSQVRLYKSSLVLKGLDEDTAQMVVDKAIKDGVLYNKADEAYKAIELVDADSLKAIEQAQAAAEHEYLVSINQFNQRLTTSIVDGKGMKFIIPDTEKTSFTKFVKDHIEYESGSKRFLIVQKIEDSLDKQLEAMYLLYKKGDLSGLIQRSAETKNVNRFKRTIDKSKTQAASGADTTSKTTFVALGDL